MTIRIVNRWTALAVFLLAAAALLRFGLTPWLLELPPNYASQTEYVAESRFRDTPDSVWQSVTLIARRVDQALVNTGAVIVIQGDIHWFTDSGQVIFENAGIYGVDRRTLRNVPGYGNINRTGQFLFPAHIPPADFSYWDPMFIGQRRATFDRIETLAGLPVTVFRFSGTDMDETAGYDYLRDVPERYRTHTDGQGTLWIEPLSGLLVDYEEQGTSYFVDAASGRRVADFYVWSDRYTPTTKAAQLALARTARLRTLSLETWLPGGLVLAGLAVLGLGLFRRKKFS